MTAKQLSPRTLQRLGNRAARDILIQAVEEIRGHGLPSPSCCASPPERCWKQPSRRSGQSAKLHRWRGRRDTYKNTGSITSTAETEGGNYRLVPTNKPGTTTFSHYTVSFRSTGGNRKQISSAAANFEEAEAIAEHHHQHVG